MYAVLPSTSLVDGPRFSLPCYLGLMAIILITMSMDMSIGVLVVDIVILPPHLLLFVVVLLAAPV